MSKVIEYTCPVCGNVNKEKSETEDVGGIVYVCKKCGAKVTMKERFYKIDIV